MRTSETTTKLFAALAKAQGALEAAIKDNTNPAFRSKYADLTGHVEVIRPVYRANGLFFTQEVSSTPDDQGVSVTTRICHESGEWLEHGPLFVPANKHDAQGFGSATSYGRRYALSAAAGTVQDDDDGNAAVQSKPVASVPTPLGFEDWLKKMQAFAAATPSVQAFRDEYAKGLKKHRAYLEETNKSALDAMVAAAKGNEAALHAGAGVQ